MVLLDILCENRGLMRPNISITAALADWSENCVVKKHHMPLAMSLGRRSTLKSYISAPLYIVKEAAQRQ